MKKILIAIDYNPTAQKVAETGFKLAKAMHAQVILLHVIVDSTYYSSLQYSPIMGYIGLNPEDAMLEINNDKVKEAAQNYLDKSKHHLGDESIQTIVKEGSFAETILETAADLHADIIVIGSHSRSGLEKILMGSVAEKVLQHSSVPLLIVPIKEHIK